VQDAERLTQAALSLRKKLTERDLARSNLMLHESARLYRIAGQPSKVGGVYLEIAKSFVMASRYNAAVHAYATAYYIAGADRNVRCAALSGMARTYANIDRSAEAKRYSQQAVTVCQESSDSRVRADAMESRGEVLFWTDDLKNAVEFLTRARDLFRGSHDDDGQAAATLMLAFASDEGDSTLPFSYAEEASRLWSSAGNQYGTARAHLAQAYFASKAGSLGLAQCHSDQAFKVFHRVGDKDNEGIALNLLGKISRETGDTETELIDYGKARADFVTAQDRPGEIEAISGMASALTALHRDRLSMPLYALKFQLAQQGHVQSLMASALLDIAGVYQLRQQRRRAEQLFHRAIVMYRAADNTSEEGNALILLAKLKVETGDLEQAVTFLEDALKLKEKTAEIADIARIQYELADIYSRQNHSAQAKDAIEKTIKIIESQRLKISNFDSRATYFASVHRYYSLYVQVLMTLDRENPGLGFSQTAFEAAERSKVRALLDLLENTQHASSCDELLAGGLDPNALPRLQGEKTGTPDAVSARPLTLDEIRGEIGDSETVLLEYALGDEKSYAWLVDREKISAYELPSATQIRRSAQAFREALMPPAAREHETASEYLQKRNAKERARLLHSRQLAKFLLGGLDIPSGRRVLIVPDGPLQYVPFAALPEPGSQANTAFFIAQHSVAMLPSASVLAVFRKVADKRPPPTAGVAIFADPVFEGPQMNDSPNADVSTTSEHDLKRALQDTRGSQHIARLLGSRTEALAIQQIVGAEHTRLALGFDANRDAVINGSLTHTRVIHFATHGIADTRHPEMSGLILSLLNARGEHQNGYLRLGDIYNMKLSADLVVLSSCDSALGKDLGSEGTIGLPRGFLYAGARSVIASLWKVDDDATAILMMGLYHRMQQGESPQAALRESQLDLAKDPRYSQPYYWAAFVLEGDYRWGGQQ
jgi:CHAT domain-containing protein